MNANTQSNPTNSTQPALPDDQAFITVDEVARRLRKSRRTVYHWIKHRTIPHYRIGRNVMFRWPEVQDGLKPFRVRPALRVPHDKKALT